MDQSLQSSALAQRLNRRLITSPGVINVYQLPTQPIQRAANQLIQRSHLPDQIQARYNHVDGIQTATIYHLFQRSRVERSGDLDTPLHSSPVTMVPAGDVIQRSVEEGQSSASTPFSVPQFTPTEALTGTFRVRRRAEATSTSPDSSVSSQPMQVSQPSSPATDGSTVHGEADSGADSGSMGSGERVRIQRYSPGNSVLRQIDPEGDRPSESQPSLGLPLHSPTPAANSESHPAHSPPSNPGLPTTVTPQVTPSEAISVIHRQSSSESIRRVVGQLESKPGLESRPLHSTLNQAIPISEGTTASTPAHSMPLIVARKENTQEPVSQAEITSALVPTTKTVIVRTSPLPQPLLIQRQLQAATIARSPDPETSQSYPLQPQKENLTNSAFTQPMVLQRRVLPDTLPFQQAFSQLGLPLSVLPRSPQIARQTDTPDVSPTMTSPAIAVPPPPPSSETGSSSAAPNVKQVADQVSRLIRRQLVIERERRGIGRWY